MEQLLAPVPRHLLWAIGFEARLTAGEGRVDAFLGYDQSSRDLLIEVAEVLGTAAGPDSQVWGGLKRFARRWGAHEATAWGIDHVWLEFDAPPELGGAPGVFIERSAPPAGTREPSAWSDRCLGIVEDLSGVAVGTEVVSTFEECISRLPAPCFPTSLGFFLGRPHPGLRLCLKGFGASSLAEYLAHVKWPGDPSRVKGFLSRLVHRPRQANGRLGMLHLDLREAVLPRIGVEMVLDIAPQIRDGRLASGVLEHITSNGLCPEAKATALASWPGAHFVSVVPEAPRQLYVRRVNHVKLEFDPSPRIGVKVYFGARMHMPRYLAVPGRPFRMPMLERHDG